LRRCDAHLGHVFHTARPTAALLLNSAALKFVEAKKEKAGSQAGLAEPVWSRLFFGESRRVSSVPGVRETRSVIRAARSKIRATRMSARAGPVTPRSSMSNMIPRKSPYDKLSSFFGRARSTTPNRRARCGHAISLVIFYYTPARKRRRRLPRRTGASGRFKRPIVTDRSRRNFIAPRSIISATSKSGSAQLRYINTLSSEQAELVSALSKDL